jgi:hypothetical protein
MRADGFEHLLQGVPKLPGLNADCDKREETTNPRLVVCDWKGAQTASHALEVAETLAAPRSSFVNVGKKQSIEEVVLIHT